MIVYRKRSFYLSYTFSHTYMYIHSHIIDGFHLVTWRLMGFEIKMLLMTLRRV